MQGRTLGLKHEVLMSWGVVDPHGKEELIPIQGSFEINLLMLPDLPKSHY